MSYNLLSGSVDFVGDSLGLAENLVNTHATQTIAGAKTFYNVTASSQGDGTVGLKVLGTLDVDGDTAVDGDVSAAQYLKHYGDPDTNLEFPNNDELALNVGGKMVFNADAAGISINGDGTPTKSHDANFTVYSRDVNYGMKLDANTRSIHLGWIANPDFNRSDVLVHISSSYHTGSLLSVGHGKTPVLAVSGGAANGTDPRVVISGSVFVGGQPGTIKADGNIVAGAIVTGSVGLRGELLNIGHGLEHVAGAGHKNLSVKANAAGGIEVGGSGVGMNVYGLGTVGSVNTGTSNQDYIAVSDFSDSNDSKKMGVGDLLGNTLGSAANLGSGNGEVYKAVTSREIKLRSIKHAAPITVTNNTNDIEIGLSAIGASGQIMWNDGTALAGTSLINIDEKPGTGYPGGPLDTSGATISIGGPNIEVNLSGAVAIKGVNSSGHTQGDSILFRVDGHTTSNHLVVTGSGRVGIGTNAPISTLDVAGKIAITSESSTPAQPADGKGFLYSKAGGGLYWRSYDLAEVNLTTGGAGGANGEVQFNMSGAIEGNGNFTMVQSVTPNKVELYLTGAMHAQNVEVNGIGTTYDARVSHLTCSEGLFLQAGMRKSVNFKTANYTLDPVDSIVLFSNSNNLTGTLPAITENNVGTIYTIKNLNSGEVHITGSNPGVEQYIDGVQYLVLSGATVGNGPYISVVSYPSGGGYDWAVIARHLDTGPGAP
jgi:hypothetical protein